MHGRKKTTQLPSESELTAVQNKTTQWSKTVDSVLSQKMANDYSTDSLEFTAKVLRSNPDFYSVWNFRKEILMSMIVDLSVISPLPAISIATGLSSADNSILIDNDIIRDKELKLSEDCIRKNPKSCEL
jgi:hypothetical protein